MNKEQRNRINQIEDELEILQRINHSERSVASCILTELYQDLEAMVPEQDAASLIERYEGKIERMYSLTNLNGRIKLKP